MQYITKPLDYKNVSGNSNMLFVIACVIASLPIVYAFLCGLEYIKGGQRPSLFILHQLST